MPLLSSYTHLAPIDHASSLGLVQDESNVIVKYSCFVSTLIVFMFLMIAFLLNVQVAMMVAYTFLMLAMEYFITSLAHQTFLKLKDHQARVHLILLKALLVLIRPVGLSGLALMIIIFML